MAQPDQAAQTLVAAAPAGIALAMMQLHPDVPKTMHAFKGIASYVNRVARRFNLPTYVLVATLILVQDLLRTPHGVPPSLRSWHMLVTISALLACKMCLEERMFVSDILKLTTRHTLEDLLAAEEEAVLYTFKWGDHDAFSVRSIARRLGSFRAAMLTVLLNQPALHGSIELRDTTAFDTDAPPIRVLLFDQDVDVAAAQKELLLELSPHAVVTPCLFVATAVHRLAAVDWSAVESPLLVQPHVGSMPLQAIAEHPAVALEAEPTHRPTLLLVELEPDGGGLGEDRNGLGDEAGSEDSDDDLLNAPGLRIIDALRGHVADQPTSPLEPGAPLVVTVSAQARGLRPPPSRRERAPRAGACVARQGVRGALRSRRMPPIV